MVTIPLSTATGSEVSSCLRQKQCYSKSILKNGKVSPRQQYPGSPLGPETWQARVHTAVDPVRSGGVVTLRFRNRIKITAVCGRNFKTTVNWQKPGAVNERAVSKRSDQPVSPAASEQGGRKCALEK